MKCKYCGAKIDFLDYIFQLGKCSPCQCRIWSIQFELQREMSRKYWDKKGRRG